MVLTALATLAAGPAGLNAATEPASVNDVGEYGNAFSWEASISDDGSIVAFSSYANNLVAGDGNVNIDVFVHDFTLAQTVLVSGGFGGAPADGLSVAPAVSPDGDFVAFESNATNLVPVPDTNGLTDVYLHILSIGLTLRVSAAFDIGETPDGGSFQPTVSADGLFVAYESDATNLVLDDENRRRDIFVYDLLDDSTSRVSVPTPGGMFDEADGSSFGASISADGRFVAFQSYATNLVDDDTNHVADLFVHDRDTLVTSRIVGPNGEGNGHSYAPSISADGRFVAFYSAADNLVDEDNNGRLDVFVYDRMSGALERVSVDSDGMEANGDSFAPSISGDGNVVAFHSMATNLVDDDTNGVSDVFVRDRALMTTTRASVSSADAQGNGVSQSPALSQDGRFAAFESRASNLAPDDANGTVDVYVRGRLLAPLQLGTLTGQVLDVRTGLPVAGVVVHVRGRSAETGADGRYEIADVPAGRQSIRFDRSDDPTYLTQRLRAEVERDATTVLNAWLRELVRGDLDGNGTVDSFDVPAFLDVLLGRDRDPVHWLGSDMDGSGYVDGRDVELLVRLMTEGQDSGSSHPFPPGLE